MSRPKGRIQTPRRAEKEPISGVGVVGVVMCRAEDGKDPKCPQSRREKIQKTRWRKMSVEAGDTGTGSSPKLASDGHRQHYMDFLGRTRKAQEPDVHKQTEKKRLGDWLS